MKISFEDYDKYNNEDFVLCKCCEEYYDHEDGSEECNLCLECSEYNDDEIEDIEINENKDYWNLLPGDIKVYIMNFNKEAERREFKINYYPHLKGKIKIYKSPKIKSYYWMNCVSCGCDTSMRKAKNYHWCYNCFEKYGRRWKETDRQYAERMRRVIERGDTTPLLTSRPLLIGKDNCPFILNDKLVLVPPGEHKNKYMNLLYNEYIISDD
jgi:hypothetical protein